MTNVIKAITLASLLVSINTYAKYLETIEKTFLYAKGNKFSLENINGSATFLSWEKDTIHIVAEIETKNEATRDKIQIKMIETSNGIKVVTHYEDDWNSKNYDSGSVDYTVHMPKSASLDNVALVNGGLTIENIEGAISAELVNGAIHATGIANNLELKSVNGSIYASYSHLEDETSEIDLKTVNGSIKAIVPANINASVIAETMHGSIKNDFSLSADEGMLYGTSMEGKIGDGDIDISMESVNGSLRLLKIN